MKLKSVILIFLSIVISSNALAQSSSGYGFASSDKPMAFIGTLVLSGGGDKIGEITYYRENEDGNRERTGSSNMTAGGLFALNLGAGIRPFSNGSEWETQITLGYKSNNKDGENGKINFTRYPVDIIQFYNLNKLRFGAGITYHMSPDLSSKVNGNTADFDLESALGFTFQVDYFFEKAIFIGAKVELIEYQQKSYEYDSAISDESKTLDGNNIGIVFGIRY